MSCASIALIHDKNCAGCDSEWGKSVA